MNRRLTTRWIRTFLHAHKLSSFQDKWNAIREETNPYYLLEWLVVERTDDDEAFWAAWEGERTPGMERGSRIGVEPCFRDQLLLELWLGEALTDDQAARLAAAFAEMSEAYGADVWDEGIRRVRRRAEEAMTAYEAYAAALRDEMLAMEEEAERERLLLEAEAEELKDEGFDLEAELRRAKAKWDRKKQELPAKLLQSSFPSDPLLRYMAVRGLPRPVERVRQATERIASSGRHPILAWANALRSADYDALYALWRKSETATEWSGWFAAALDRSELTRGWQPTEDRQREALRWIASVPEGEAEPWLQAAYRASGWEGRLAEPEFADRLLHRFVWSALENEQRRKRLREDVVLQHWSAFSAVFMRTEEAPFESLSWTFVLDPESVQQRLLRHGAEGRTADEIIRRLCAVYGEGIRRGVDVRLVVSLYAYLAKHDKEAFYSFVHGAKTIDEALPLMELSGSTLSQLFRGEGVRQASARKHLLVLFLERLEEDARPAGAMATAGVRKLAGILSYDKRSAVVAWMQRHARDWRERIGEDGERLFTKLLKLRWIGTAKDEEEQHRNVKEWLTRHSDWVQFETDAPNVELPGVAYKIVRPGAIDAESGELLSRVIVRAEWSDRSQVGKLLDDLKLL